MYPTKKADVDRHVEECLKKINNETERNLRCFSFAKQYFKIERYEEVRRFVSSYLSVKPNSAEGHHLLGRALEKLGRTDAAIQAYSTSLRLDPKQNNLVIRVCELMASEDVELDQTGARYFCELARSFDPHNPAVFSLKQRILTSQNEDPHDVSNMLLKELENRPTDVNIRVRLLKHLLQYNMVKEAYKHASDIESRDIQVFLNDLSWYETVAEVLVKYQKSIPLAQSLSWNFWFLSVSVLDKLASLSLDEHSDNIKTSAEYIVAVFNYDQTLTKASQNISDCPDKQLILEFLNHHRAQLCFHFATLVFKQAKKDLIKFKEALNITLPLLFFAYNARRPDFQSIWYNNCPEDRRNYAKRWHKEAAFRCSQTGHILLGAVKDNRKSTILEKAAQYSMGMWREQLFKKIFITRDQQVKMTTSYFLTDQHLLEIDLKFPDQIDLQKFDEEAQLIYPDSLHHHIWIALNYINDLANVNCAVFGGLQYSIKHLKNCGAETLNMLDIQAFVYCATLCAHSNIENTKHIAYFNNDKPSVLPAAVTQELASLSQNTFFKSAYKMYKNEYETGLDQIRTTLIEGIKILRCVDSTLDVKLLVKLATIFAERAKLVTKQSEVEANEARAEVYWKAALPILEKIKSNQAVFPVPNKLFTFKAREMVPLEVIRHIESGKLFSACQLMKKKEYERSLRLFDALKDPYASFYQAQIYKHMADEQVNQNRENVTSEMRSQNIILLSRARDCLYLTLDRLREPSVDPKHPLNTQLGTEIEKIERLLSRIDPDCNNRNECDGMSDENVSSNESENYASYGLHSTYLPQQNHSTPHRGVTTLDFSKREARPSPERLDAQIRQLAASKESAINHIIEHNRIMIESHRTLVEELKGFKDSVHVLTSTVENIKHNYNDLKDVKKSVQELKTSIEELDNFKNISDVVYEMKREIAELKKDIQNKPHQLSEEDIYGLATDYTADYGVNATMYGANPNFYHQPGRLPSATSLYAPPPLYPGMYPPMYYGGLGLPHPPGGLPLAGTEQQLSDFRAMGLPVQQNFPAVPPTSFVPTTLPPPPNASFTLASIPPSTSANVPNVPQLGLGAATSNLFNRDQKITQLFPSAPTAKAPPVNVVITTSDPLPSTKTTTSQPVLSVTIPPQHLKGLKAQAHNYQIPLPSTANVSTAPSVLNKPPPAIHTQSLLSNIAPPIYSAIETNNVSLGLQIEKTLDQTFTPTKNTSNISTNSVEEHDPCPDFKPIIPLPDEVPVNTGEENETVLFCDRAKLYRWFAGNKEWRERGVGVLKILKNPQSGKVRILMRRDQVHKICANHFLTPDMVLSTMPNSNRAYVWAAHDFADEEMVLEKLCVKFKGADEAKKFYDAFESAKKDISDPIKAKAETRSIKPIIPIEATTPKASPVSLGGFTFSTTPTFNPKPEVAVTTPVISNKPETTSPFSGFSFSGKKTIYNEHANLSNISDEHPDDFIPTAEFKPVVALPELVEVKTGEEDADVLFESRAKLFRIDTSGDTREWKERGVGVMKVLKNTTVRLVMRREQVHKVCCNHQLLREMEFKIMTTNPKALIWCAKDFADGVLKPETFSVRFKNEELAREFLKTVTDAQRSLDEDNCVSTKDKHMKTEPKLPTVGFGDKFKPVKGSWSCKNCYIDNDSKSNYCTACETAKNDTLPKKSDDTSSGAAFSFGVSNTSGWGDAFKPKEGTWECKSCCTRNEGASANCASCTAPKDPAAAPPKKPESVNLDTGGLKFNFGIPASTVQSKSEQQPKSTWGDTFKPKEGTWECKSCYTRNEGARSNCVSCTGPKDPAAAPPKKLESVNLDTGGLKFSYGVPASTVESKSEQQPKSTWGDQFKPKEGTWECKSCYTRNEGARANCVSCTGPKDPAAAPPKKLESVNLDTGGLKFSYGVPASTVESKSEQQPKSTWGDAFKPKAGSWACDSCYTRNEANVVYCISCEHPKDDTVPKKEPSKGINLDTPGMKFTFGMPQVTQAEGKATFTFGQSSIATASPFTSSTAPSFTLAGTTEKKPETSFADSSKFVFGSPQKHDFEFTPRSPRRISTGQNDDESETSYVEEEEDTIYFKPVVPLPDKVEVKTGEEEEEVLYCHRAKLFRFVGGEWKERGIGDIKILKRTDTGKLRVLMRREQVFKICLNHILTSDIKYLPKDDKTWLFSAPDFSEGEIANEQFCIRFKSPEVALEFKKAVSNAVGESGVPSVSEKGEEGSAGVDQSSSDVQLVWETPVTPEEKQEAIDLKLPPKFMAYRQLPDCVCEQCKKDDEYLYGKLPTISSISSSSSPGVFSPNSSSLSSTFGTPKNSSTDSPVKSTDTLRGLLSKPSLIAPPKTSTGSPAPVISASPFAGLNVCSPSNAFTTPTTGGLFGSKTTSSIFTTTTAAEAKSSSSSLNTFSFIQTPTSLVSSTTSSGGSIFGGGSSGTFTVSGSIFDVNVTSQTPPTSSIFGSSDAVTPQNSSSTSIFATAQTTTSSSTFGAAATPPVTSQSIFGGFTTPSTGGSIFGGSGSTVFGSGTPAFGKGAGEGKPLFGSNNLFGNTAAVATPIFGATKPDSTTTVGSTPELPSTTTELKEDDAPVLNCNTGLSFASLAANVPGDSTPAFVKSESSSTTPFSFLGAGAPVFGSLNDSRNRSASGDGDEEGAAGDDEYDPHYEPIVPLPDAIVVSTGEEDENVLFNERAKLYRYDADNKEWKERGVGALKILHHPGNHTYRFLLRREQVHKVVLNQLLVADLDLQPMKLSDKAWMWAGYNYTEDGSSLEKLAVRFKNADLANNFFKVAQEAIEKIKTGPPPQSKEAIAESQGATRKIPQVAAEVVVETQDGDEAARFIPHSIQNFGLEDVSSDNARGETDEEDEDDLDEDDDRTTMFVKRCTLHEEIDGQWHHLDMGNLQVYYDSELYAARICFCNDHGLVVSNTLIGMNTQMDCDKNCCIWKAVEWGDGDVRWRKLRATFSSSAAADEFYCTYSEGLNYAHEYEIMDCIPTEEDEEETEDHD